MSTDTRCFREPVSSWIEQLATVGTIGDACPSRGSKDNDVESMQEKRNVILIEPITN